MSAAAFDRVAALAIEDCRRLITQGRFKEARNILTEVLNQVGGQRKSLTPRRSAELWYHYGEVQDALGDAPKARDAWQKAMKADISYKRALLRMVESRIYSDLPVRAEDLDAMVDYGSLGRDKKTKRRVHELLRERLRIRLTDDPKGLNDRVELLERIHRESPAINYPKQYLGRAAYMRKDYRGAIEFLASVVDRAAESSSILNIIGRCHEKLGELSRAASAYEKSLGQREEQPGILFRLGRLKLRLAQLT
ncbi:MAG: tetratricopeptide repeat protein [Planctomycetota bacterium]